jgi:hypothetical protein
MARSLDRDEKIHPKVFQKRVELMNAAEKAALDQVMKYMSDKTDDRKISLDEARTIFEIALQQYYNSHPKKDG